MPTTVWGIVREGKVIPEKPLPEGASVQITLADEATAVPPDLQEELDAWALGSAQALKLIERLADEGENDELKEESRRGFATVALASAAHTCYNRVRSCIPRRTVLHERRSHPCPLAAADS